MLTITQQPNAIVYSKNPIIFKIQTDNYVINEGVYAIGGFVGFSSPSAGAKLRFLYGGNQIEFTFANSLDSSGTTLRTNVGGLNIYDYLNEVIVPDLKTNNQLYNDYFIEYILYNGIHHSVKFTARNKGETYSLTFSQTGLGTLTPIVPTEGVDRAIRENFKVFCEVYISTDVTVTGETNFKKILTFDQIPDNNYICEFDLSEVLSNYVAALKPDPTQTKMDGLDARTFNKNAALKYYIRYGESYGVPSKDYITYNSINTTLYVLYGGVDKIAVPSFSLYNDVFTNVNRILTTQPLVRYISKKSPAILYWISSGTNLVRLYLKLYYHDNTVEENNTISFSLNASNNKPFIVHAIPVHYTQIQSVVNPAKTLVKYDVTIYVAGSPAIQMSQTISYIIDEINHENERCFLYKNSRGGFDVLRCTGVMSYIPEFNFDTASRVLPSGYKVSDGETRAYNSYVTHPYKISTGFHSLKEILSYEDFFLSEEVYLITEDNLHLPVIKTSKKAEMPDDNAQTFALEFEYELKYRDTSYTLR